MYDYPLAKVPTAGWVANVAFFQLLLFAFDLIHYFRRLCLPPAYRTKTLKTLRMELLVIPGRLVTKPEEVQNAIAFARTTPGPVLLEFRVEQEEAVFPMVPTGAALDQMLRRPVRQAQ